MLDATTWNQLAQNWADLLLAVLWQSTLLAAVVALLAWLLRQAAPAVRYWLWQIVAFKMLLAPLWTMVLPVPWLAPVTTARNEGLSQGAHEPSAVSEAPRQLTSDNQGPPAQPDAIAQQTLKPPQVAVPQPAARAGLSWQAWFMIAWGILVVGQVTILVRQRLHLGKLLRRCSPAPAALVDQVAECAGRLGLRRPPAVRTTATVCSPFVVGIVRPMIVVPATLSTGLPSTQLTPVLIHELAHIKRHDLFWGWIPQVARMLYFFHPVAHWVAFRIRLESELACDGWAMATSGQSAASYADLLVRVVSQLTAPIPASRSSVAAASLDGRGQFDLSSAEREAFDHKD